jgi:hypothetical protein
LNKIFILKNKTKYPFILFYLAWRTIFFYFFLHRIKYCIYI